MRACRSSFVGSLCWLGGSGGLLACGGSDPTRVAAGASEPPVTEAPSGMQEPAGMPPGAWSGGAGSMEPAAVAVLDSVLVQLSGPDTSALDAAVAATASFDNAGFAAAHAVLHVVSIDYDPLAAKGLDLIKASFIAPTQVELDVLSTHGFAIAAGPSRWRGSRRSCTSARGAHGSCS
jgi:hypothetical protein